jgi:hypothetical protein
VATNVKAAYEKRLAEATQRCETEKADVLARMKRDLAAATAQQADVSRLGFLQKGLEAVS